MKTSTLNKIMYVLAGATLMMLVQGINEREFPIVIRATIMLTFIAYVLVDVENDEKENE